MSLLDRQNPCCLTIHSTVTQATSRHARRAPNRSAVRSGKQADADCTTSSARCDARWTEFGEVRQAAVDFGGNVLVVTLSIEDTPPEDLAWAVR